MCEEKAKWQITQVLKIIEATNKAKVCFNSVLLSVWPGGGALSL